MKDYLIINCKAYKEGSGEEALELAKICDNLQKEFSNVEIIVCVDALDLQSIASQVSIKVFAEHVDALEFGAHTGYLPVQMVKEHGAAGTLINHSEHTISKYEIKKAVEMAKEVSLFSCVCAKNAQEVEELSTFSPDVVTVEPPELIGGNISVSTAQPELIKESVDVCSVPLLVGAGVKNMQDVKIAKELGSKGILVASGVVKAPDKEAAVRDLLEGF